MLGDGYTHGARSVAESAQPSQHGWIIYDGGEALRAPRGGGKLSAERGVRRRLRGGGGVSGGNGAGAHTVRCGAPPPNQGAACLSVLAVRIIFISA